MAFWAENQRQSPKYVKFGTVPGRNCTYNFHDKHQPTHYPLYFGEHQDQGRESRPWTVPGSRKGGALQDYTNWTDSDLTTPTSHFPFILDRHPRHPHDLGDYQHQESREREWTAGEAQLTLRECERGMVREGWQRRCEPCSPIRYQRHISKRSLSDSSYRELEAWAARYSHSLPRRRRIEAELRGASHGLSESNLALERDGRSGTDPRVAALHQARVSAHNRDVGQWGQDRVWRQQTTSHYPAQAFVPDTSHMLGTKEKSNYHRRMFRHPPCYMAPPPYNSPHKISPVMHHHSDKYTESREQEGKTQTCYSHSTARGQDVYVDLQKEDFTKAEAAQEFCSRLEGSKNQRPANSLIHIQNRQMQPECRSSVQQPQTLQTVQNTKRSLDTPSKVIEGRKFRLGKNTGGMTVFCLVSRIVDTTEFSSSPVCSSQTNTASTEIGHQVSTAVMDSSYFDQTHKLADEVDLKVSTFTKQFDPSVQASNLGNLKAKQNGAPTWEQAATCKKQMLEYNLSNKADAVGVSRDIYNTNDVHSVFERQIGQSSPPVSTKYPLWREPSFTNRCETESSSPYCLRANREEGESDGLHNRDDKLKVSSHPIDTEVRRPDVKEDTESEDSSGLLVIDTTCVVVKMELIASPKKELIQYFGSSPVTEHSPLDIQSNNPSESVQSNNSQLNHGVTTDKNIETRTQTKHMQVDGSEISPPCTASALVCQRETLEERAERILGISLCDSDTEQKPDDAKSFLEQHEEGEPSPVKNNDTGVLEQFSEAMKEDDKSKRCSESSQTDEAVSLKESDEAEQVKNEGTGDVSRLQEQISQETEMTEKPLLESNSEDIISELNQKEEKQRGDDDDDDDADAATQPSSKCLSTCTDICNSSPSDSHLTSLSCISGSNTDASPDPELAANLSPYPENLSEPLPFPHSESQTTTQQSPSPLTPESSLCSTPHKNHSPSPPPLDLACQTADPTPTINLCSEDQDEEGVSSLVNTEIGHVVEHLVKAVLEEKAPLQEFDDEAEDDACVEESKDNEEQLPKESEEEFICILDQKSEMSDDDANDCQTKVKILHSREPSAEISDSSPLSPLDSPDSKMSQVPFNVTLSSSPCPSLPHNTEPAADLGTTAACPSDDTFLHPDAPVASIPKTFPPSLLDAAKNPQQLPCPPHSESALLLLASSNNPPQEGSVHVTSELLSLAELSQCPLSLWDAVNRIRRHTAPDSENEEEEMSELWDPESTGEGRACLEVVVDTNSEDGTSDSSDGLQEGPVSSSSHTRITNGDRIIFDKAEQVEVSKEESVEDTEVRQIQQDPCGRAEEDALSCSSTNSHSSDDTIIAASEGNVEEMMDDAAIQNKTEDENKSQAEHHSEFHKAEEEDDGMEMDDDQDGINK